MKKLLIIALLLLSNIAMATNLTINSFYTLNTSGDYIITIESGGFLNITEGNINIQNLNINSGAIGMTIGENTFVTGTSLNMNGGFQFKNFSKKTKFTGAGELQNGGNSFYSSQDVQFTDFQINDDTSKMNIVGCTTKFTVTNNLNLNGSLAGALRLDGAELFVGGLNVGAPNVITGDGLVKVLNTLNLNHNLTTSDKITFCWGGHLNQPEKVGSAVRSCNYKCTSLPVKLSLFKVSRLDERRILVNFKFEDLDKMSKMRVLVSKDITNKVAYLVINRTQLKEGVEYSFTVNLEK